MEQLGTTLDHPTTTEPAIPPMSVPHRVREAARAAWTTLRTGRHIEAEAFMDGARAGMDLATDMAVDAFTKAPAKKRVVTT